MEHSASWEANSYSASQEILQILWNQKVHYQVYNTLLLVPIHSQINPAHAPPSYFFQMHFNIILPSMPRISNWFLSFRQPYQNSVCIHLLSHLCHMLHLPHSTLIILIMPDNEYKSQNCINGYLGMHFDSGTGIPLFLSSLALFWLQGSVVPIQSHLQMALILDFHPPIIYKQFFRHPKTFPMLRANLKISDTFGADINIKRACKS